MLSYTIKRVFVMRSPVDFRKGAASLTALAYKHGLDPYKGDCLISLARHLHSVKVLCGDEIGVWLLERRYEGGRLLSPWQFLANPSLTEITVAQLTMLLEGTNFEVKKFVKPFKEI
jgi:hypothetical protein